MPPLRSKQHAGASRAEYCEKHLQVSQASVNRRLSLSLPNGLFGDQEKSRELSKPGFEETLMAEFIQRCLLPVSAEEALAWHSRPGAFDRLLPPWEKIEIVKPAPSLTNGSRAELALTLGPFRKRWIAEHHALADGIGFQDVQVAGPFARWEHTHRMIPADSNQCWLEDDIRYAEPGGLFGHWILGRSLRRSLARTFAFRHRVTRSDLLAHSKFKGRTSMKILVTGSTGLVGSAVVPFLTTGGHQVLRLVRGTAQGDDQIGWNPMTGETDVAKLEGLDAVVHLAGENIATGRWNAAKKARIRDSRVHGTRLLSETLAKLSVKPKVLVCASAIGYYGDRGNDEMTEVSPPGKSFLCEVCRDWEAAAELARQAGIRVVNLRIGVVLTPRGGALEKMLLPFKLCAGGVVGSGQQYWSWIALDDVVGAIHHALNCESLSGPVNCVSPQTVTNRVFTKTLGSVLNRPTIVPMPAFAAKLALGEMGDELLLASTRVVPQRLKESGYEFRLPNLDAALRHLLGK